MDARGNGSLSGTISWHFNQDYKQETKGPANKGYPSESKEAALLSPPISPCPYWTDSICVFRDRKAFGRAIVDWRTIPLKFSFWGGG
ncbi:hypothetical protein CEXT_602961 [Caerostris extrusa]|uniref:Uncharacterized protein n=1 Tax=Caerostris extrusa TaxID=172846 RepID=A0AAV4U6J1_CAEEX|nr:hypothetical protein CEXT_602961 [Caerostris extrusa]